MKLRIFTDGACSENPGPGGWAAVFNLSESYRILSGNDLEATNNRMELKAVIEGISKAYKYYEKCQVIEVYSDSAYVVNAVRNEWIKAWKRNKWLTSKREPVKNKDLWLLLDNLLSEGAKKKVKLDVIKIKGHSGNTFNEIADKAAKAEVLKAKSK